MKAEPGTIHLLAFSDRFILSRKPYRDMKDVEADYHDVLLWIGPIATGEVFEQMKRTFFPPDGEDWPFTRAQIKKFLASPGVMLEGLWS